MSDKLKHLPFLLLALAGNSLFAQVNDAQLWLSASLEKKLTRALSVGFTEEIRMNENITEVGTIYSDIGLSCVFLKRFKAGASYRYTLKRRLDDTYKQFNSWYVEGSYREKLKPVILVLRVRYQSRYAEMYTSEIAGTPANHFRVKRTVPAAVQPADL